MKYINLLLATSIILASCESKKADLEQRVTQLEEKVANEPLKEPENSNIVASENISVANLPEISFAKKFHDFGKIKEGETVKYTFEFTNTGKSPLIVQNASASCGCTVPDWPHHPIEPGKSGKIVVEFNSAGRPGNHSKNIAITANTNPSITTVSIAAVVE